MQRRSWLRILGIVAIGGCTSAQSLDGPARFLVKLGTDLTANKNQAGDRVTAFVISPERFLAGVFEGAIDQASGGSLQFTFHSLKFKGKTYRIVSKVLDFVNSKGHKLVDERERAVQVISGRLQSAAPDFALDEGAEISLEITPVKQ